MRIGTITHLEPDMNSQFARVRDFGLTCCQINGWDVNLFTDEIAKNILECCEKYNITVTAFWCGWCPPAVWNFYDGPETLGLVPQTYRHQRMKELIKGSDFAKKFNVTDVATHVGFIPENPHDSNYLSLISSIREVAAHCMENGQFFNFETGQETPVALMRIFEDIGLDNLGVNLDPANLIMYGKANPVDALEMIGKYVRGIHGKDGKYPTDGKNLGLELKVGTGKVNYPLFVQRLNEIGYSGTITIEREISGDQQTSDIEDTVLYLDKLIKNYKW